MQWAEPTEADGIVWHQFELMHPQAFQEVNEQACDGTAYHAMESVRDPVSESVTHFLDKSVGPGYIMADMCRHSLPPLVSREWDSRPKC